MALSWPPLVQAQTLAERLQDPALRLFDATVQLARPPAGGPYEVRSGRVAYVQAHIPGAAFADVPGELSDSHSPLPFTLQSTARFAAAAEWTRDQALPVEVG